MKYELRSKKWAGALLLSSFILLTSSFSSYAVSPIGGGGSGDISDPTSAISLNSIPVSGVTTAILFGTSTLEGIDSGLLFNSALTTPLLNLPVANALSSVIRLGQNGDAHSRLKITGEGLHLWGDGTAVGDTNLYRSAANVLKTDDAFTVGGVLTAGTGAFTTLSASLAYSVKSGAYTAVAGDKLLVNTTSAAVTITLPATPAVGNAITIADAQGTFGTNSLTVGRNGSSIDGSATDLTSNTNNAAFELVFAGGAKGWQVIRYQ